MYLAFVTSQRAKSFMLDLPDNAPVSLEMLFPTHKDSSDMLDMVLLKNKIK